MDPLRQDELRDPLFLHGKLRRAVKTVEDVHFGKLFDLVGKLMDGEVSIHKLDPMTNAFIQMSGVFAELELRIIRERVRSGMRNAAAKGAKIGRPQTTLDDIPANFLRHYPQYKKGAFNLTELARLCDISRTTAYKYIGLLEG